MTCQLSKVIFLTHQSLGEFLTLLFLFFLSELLLLVLLLPYTLTKHFPKLFITFQLGSAWLSLAWLSLAWTLNDETTLQDLHLQLLLKVTFFIWVLAMLLQYRLLWNWVQYEVKLCTLWVTKLEVADIC